MEKELTTTGTTLPDEATFRREIEAINKFQSIVHSCMKEGQDYGTIPGTNKPTLLKPGAEKIAKLLGLSDDYEILDRQEDWSKGFFRYIVKCNLRRFGTDYLMSSGIGECNSMESKYRWRDAKKKCPTCGQETIIKGKDEYGGGWLCFKKNGGCGAKFKDGDTTIESQVSGKVANEDTFSLVNTFLKMAKKRALVDASLSAGRLSEVFTQDIEDMKDMVEGEAHIVEPAPDATKSTREPTEVKTPPKPKEKKAEGNVEKPSQEMVNKLWSSAKQQNMTASTVNTHIKEKYNVTICTELTIEQFNEVLKWVETGL